MLVLWKIRFAEYTSHPTPLAGLDQDAVTVVTILPVVEGRLNQVAGTIGHAWPDREEAALRLDWGRWWLNDSGGIDDCRFRWSKRNSWAPSVESGDYGGESQSNERGGVHVEGERMCRATPRSCGLGL